MRDRTGADDGVLLLHFRLSPYNEKVRWALDRLRLSHRRESLLPGPHMRRVRALTGQTATPILRLDGRWVAGAARILDALGEHARAGWLAIDDPDTLARTRAIERRFDEDWVPRVRRAVLDAALADAGYFARVFAAGRSDAQRFAYRLAVPLAAPLIRAGNGIRGPASVDDGVTAIGEALDFVARETARTGFLCGAAFGRADLCAAASLAPVLNPPDSPMRRPESPPAKVRDLGARFEDHPGSAWVMAIYRNYRDATADFEGQSPY